MHDGGSRQDGPDEGWRRGLNLEGVGFTLEIGEDREYSRKGERHEGRPETGQEKMCVGVSGSCRGKERLPVKVGCGYQRLGGGRWGGHSWNRQGNPNRESVKTGSRSRDGSGTHPVSPTLGKWQGGLYFKSWAAQDSPLFLFASPASGQCLAHNKWTRNASSCVCTLFYSLSMYNKVQVTEVRNWITSDINVHPWKPRSRPWTSSLLPGFPCAPL